MSGTDERRTLLVDASVFITLAEIDLVSALVDLDGDVVMPRPVEEEVTSEPALSALSSCVDDGELEIRDVGQTQLQTAADQLGKELADDVTENGRSTVEGDVGLLAMALRRDDPDARLDFPVAVTDDKPLRQTCKTLSIPVSGSIGVLVRAVERGDIEPRVAMERLYAMDEVGARLSASLVRRAERLIEKAADR